MNKGQKINQTYKFLEQLYIDRIPVTHNCSKCGNVMIHLIDYFTHSSYYCKNCDHIIIK